MEEETIVNGSHEVETDLAEKILKPRTPKSTVVTANEHNSVMQNGNSDSHSDVTENNEIENGHVEQNGNSLLEELKENSHEIKESSSRKLRRDSRKESTPKPETPIKRELRRRETTPRASTPKKNVMSSLSSDPPHEKQNKKLGQTKDNGKINLEENNPNDGEVESQNSSIQNESIIILEETREEIISINESVEVKESEATEKSTSSFSVFSKNFNSNLSSDTKDAIEASTSSPSVVCLDSTTLSHNNSSFPNNEIKGRKSINSFSKFPGRTVSIISLDKSTKRKADNSFDNNENKRFAGEIGSGSKKSPGWQFFSSSWSPVQKSKIPQSSTPFPKRSEPADSMAVNYDEDTNLSLTYSDDKENATSNTVFMKFCSIM